jgi:membrane-bound lytic murein transglycosylase MltF
LKLVVKISFLTLLACFPLDSLWSKSLKVEKDSLLEQIKTQKTLRVATRYSLTTYYQNPSGEFRGLEHDLIKRFAKELGVEPQIIVVSDIQQLLSLIKNHRVDFAVGLTSNASPSYALALLIKR